VLAVFVNDPRKDIAGCAGRADLTFPIIADENAKIGGAYRLAGLPTHILVGADGKVRGIRIGALSKDEMDKYVREILQ
jgi:hypothetical protein